MAVRIIISPAKKMNVDTDSLPWRELPQFLPEAERLRTALRKLSYDELKALWGCNDKLAALNYERLQAMDLEKRLTPALLSYEGLQYRYMAPSVFTYAELDYVQEHLRVLSGFYGLLRPFDGVAPYRLEMQANLSVDGYKDLYAFWGSRLAQQLLSESDTILNLPPRSTARSSRRISRRKRALSPACSQYRKTESSLNKVRFARWREAEWFAFWPSGRAARRWRPRNLTVLASVFMRSFPMRPPIHL